MLLGESNWFDTTRYACAFPAMISDWRNKFQTPQLPFYFVLLAAYGSGGASTVNLRNSQMAALTLPMTGVANSIDLGDEASPVGPIHPRNKSYVGARLALHVLRDVYHYDEITVDGPRTPTADQLTAAVDGYTLNIAVRYAEGDQANMGLHILPTPGCNLTCCANATGLVTVVTGGVTIYPVVTVDPIAHALYLKAPITSTPTSVTVAMEWSSYPGCALYNRALLPSLPWSVQVPVTAAASVLTLPVVFSSNMVLQRAPYNATLWGEAPSASQVTVTLNGTQVGMAMSDQTGRWLVRLDVQKASTGNTLVVTDGMTVLTFTGVAFGDVYLCSGQSNMEANLHFSWGGMDAIQQASQYTNIRLFNVPPTASLTPLTDLEKISYKEGWVLPSVNTLWNGNINDTMGIFSAVCYYTGRDLYLALNETVPIGLFQSSFGGTVVEAWTSLERNAECGPITPLSPHENNTQNQPGGSYNAMIHPLLPMQFAAVLWYQGQYSPSPSPTTHCITSLPSSHFPCVQWCVSSGENNRYQADRYGCAFPVMIDDWRNKFQHPHLPFYFVLLAAESDGSDSTSILRAGQLQGLTLPNTAVANAIDLGDPSSPIGAVHSRNKSYVGARLARIARNRLYGESHLTYLGPWTSFADMTMTASPDGTQYQLEVDYKHLQENEGLFILPTPNCTSCCDSKTSSLLSLQLLNVSQSPVAWPAIGLDPDARVLTANLSVGRCDGGAQPWVRVRFEYLGYPQCALYNSARLPSLPWTRDMQVDMTFLTDACSGKDSGDDSGMGWMMYTMIVGVVLVVVVLAMVAALWWKKSRAAGSHESALRGSSSDSDGAYNRLDEPLASTAA